MRKLFIGVATLLAVAVVAVAAHFLVIEVGREVVTLRTAHADGTWSETRLWVVDHRGDPWLHSAGVEWEQRFEGAPQVELVRGGVVQAYLAEPDRSAHAEIDEALREKYGFADRWVRFLVPCDDSVMPVQLRRVADLQPQGSSSPPGASGA